MCSPGAPSSQMGHRFHNLAGADTRVLYLYLDREPLACSCTRREQWRGLDSVAKLSLRIHLAVGPHRYDCRDDDSDNADE